MRLPPVLVLGGGRLAAAALGSLGMLVAARAAGPAEIGLWSMVLAVQGFALHLGELGLRSAVTAQGALTGPRPLLWPYLRLRTGLALAVAAAVLAGTAVLAPVALVPMALAMAATLAIAWQVDWIPLVEGRPFAASLPLLVRPLVVLLLVAAMPGLTATGIAAAFLAAWVLAAVASWQLAGPPRLCTGAERPSSRPLLHRGAPFMLVTLSNQAQLSADLLAVGACLGTAVAGPYFLAASLATGATVFGNAHAQLVLARVPPDGLALRRAAVHALGIGLATALALAATAPLLPLLFGAGFAPAVPLLLWLLPWLVLVQLTATLQAALGAGRRQRPVLAASLAGSVALLPGLLLAAWIGEAAAFAAARGLAEAVRAGLLLRALQRPGHSRRADLVPAAAGGIGTAG